MNPTYSVDEICSLLERHRQRATYGACTLAFGFERGAAQAAGLKVARNPRTPFYSWIVGARSGLPTGYTAGERHLELEKNTGVISNPDDLLEWLAARA